jgi:hypothetical protein
MEPLYKITVDEYVHRVFSVTSYNSLKSYLRRIPTYGKNFEICQLMFSVNITKNMLIPTVLAQGVLPNKASGLTVHSSISAASAMLRLINYFTVCAFYEDMEQRTLHISHCNHYLSTEWMN